MECDVPLIFERSNSLGVERPEDVASVTTPSDVAVSSSRLVHSIATVAASRCSLTKSASRFSCAASFFWLSARARARAPAR
eukprot:3239173-Prymnesium_polylepis.1